MEKAGGRPRHEVWQHVKLLEGGRRVKCNYCGLEFAASANRIKSHINKDIDKRKGIRLCPNFPQSHNFGSDNKGNSNHSQGFSLDGLIDHRKSNGAGKIQGDAKYEEKIQVGSPFVSNRENECLQVVQYVFDCLSPGDKVYDSGHLNLSQKEFITLKSETFLDSWVINIFVEILTERERKKATPSNWYLPVTFSTAALVFDDRDFKDFVRGQKMRENYIFDQESPEKVFIPVHTGPETHGHFYLYIFYLNKNVIEIWDSLPNNKFVAATEREKTTNKLLFAMEILFEKEKGAFSNYKPQMASDILSQGNGFDCGVFVIKYMQQSDNYVKRNPLFQFDSQEERKDLAFELLNNDLNKEKQNLYDKARRHYEQVEKQDGNKRLRVDASKEDFDYYGEEKLRKNLFPEFYSIEDDGLENDIIGDFFKGYAGQIWKWIKDDNVSAIGVWGMGGSGKTALASHIYDKLLEKGDMKVIWVSVSQNSIYKLQKVIARSIMLDISDEFEVKVIARKLFLAFKEMKRCVVILDDVWDHFFLKEVGFPMSDNRIKVILTTRIWEVCQGMGCEEYTIDVESLDRKDSWALFKKTMGFYDGLSFEVKRIAWDVAYECEGLPLAIVRIATSMKGKKQVGEWRHMLECLKNLGHGQYEMDKWVFPVLRSSYDFLNNKLQRFFLYCALSTNNEYFEYDNADHLIRRFVYESIDETKKLWVQYDEGDNMLDRLKNHCMLEPSYWSWMMKKFLRALAIGIVEDTGKIMANAYKNLTEIPSDDQWRKDLQRAFLTKNKIQTIPDGTCPRCSQLSILLLNDNLNLNYISDDFFNNMPALKTLDLSRTNIQCVPKSVSNLVCLTALLLSDCWKLIDIPLLSKLKRLIVLDLSYTSIAEVPMGLESLVNLKCLTLLETNLLMPSSLISKLINLEHLLGPRVTEIDIQGLDKLEVIVATFHDISVFNTYVSFLDKNCECWSFHLSLEDANERHEGEVVTYGACYSNSIKRITFWRMDLGNIKAVLPVDIKELEIDDCQLVGTAGSCLCNVLSYGHNNNNPRQIELLDINNCKDVVYLCCVSGSCPFCFSFQLVGRLCLGFLMDLKGIVLPSSLPSMLQYDLFSHLTDLEVHDCHSMETLMTVTLSAVLQKLRTISVVNCRMMKEIVGKDDSDMELTASAGLMAFLPTILSHPTPITLSKLTSLKLNDMPQLNFVNRGLMLCPSLQTFSAYKCEQLNLPQIEISNGCQLPMEKTSDGYSWQIKTD